MVQLFQVNFDYEDGPSQLEETFVAEKKGNGKGPSAQHSESAPPSHVVYITNCPMKFYNGGNP